ncbi:hypothetical protein ACPC54_41520 [Kitasatospora sp. NPDC094028]
MNGFDAVLLSYDEPLADSLHTRLARVLGGTVKRLHGVRGMRRAYRLTAELVDTDQFFLADGDFAIDPAFPASAVEPLAAGVSMRVWRAVNPVNGLTYGYGGLKLIRTSALREMGQAVDVLAALPGRVEFSPHTAGTTLFNQTPFHAWKAGFRECAMLARGSEYGMTDASAQERIDAWTASKDGDFAEYAAAGARGGLEFARTAARDPERFEALNDPPWLHRHFITLHGEQAVAG